MSLDAQIKALVAEAVVNAAQEASKSKECMNAKEAREFLGLTQAEFKRRRHLIPKREESERKSYYLREDLLGYLRSLPCVPNALDYPSDFGGSLSELYDTGSERFSA